MEEELIQNQELLKPQEQKHEVGQCIITYVPLNTVIQQEERSKVDDLRGTPMAVGTLEEIIDDNHAIVSTSVGSEYYVNMLSFVDKDLIEPGCTVLLNNKVCYSIIRCVTEFYNPQFNMLMTNNTNC